MRRTRVWDDPEIGTEMDYQENGVTVFRGKVVKVFSTTLFNVVTGKNRPAKIFLLRDDEGCEFETLAMGAAD